MYSLYCIKNFFWNILECSFLCVQFDLLSQKHLLLPSGVSVSQLLTEHKNLTATISHRSAQWVAPQLKKIVRPELEQIWKCLAWGFTNHLICCVCFFFILTRGLTRNNIQQVPGQTYIWSDICEQRMPILQNKRSLEIHSSYLT